MFDDEFKRINKIVLGKGIGWTRYTTVGHVYKEAKQYFKFLLKHFGNRQVSFVEIGVLKGGNFVLTGHLLNTLIGVGVDNGSYRLQDEFDAKHSVAALMPRFPYKILLGDSHATQIRETVVSIRDNFDLIYIDGDHSYKGVKQDFDIYAPLANENGVIVFHDIVNIKTGVPKFWEEVKSRRKHLEFIHKETEEALAGIGVIFA